MWQTGFWDVIARKRCLNAKTLIFICSQVFTGAYLAAVDLVNFMFILFPVCGSRSKSNSGEYCGLPFLSSFIHPFNSMLSAYSWLFPERGLCQAQTNERCP
jgi:hypothetical protein